MLQGHSDSVTALLAWQSVLVSGSTDSHIRLWDISTGRCLNTLIGHNMEILALAEGDDFLASSSRDKTIRVWDLTQGASRITCRFCKDVDALISCVLVWRGVVAWNHVSYHFRCNLLKEGQLETCRIPSSSNLVATSGDSLYYVFAFEREITRWSFSATKSIATRSMPIEARGQRWSKTFTVHDGKLIGGSRACASGACLVCVWDAETLTLLHILPQPYGHDVEQVVSDGPRVTGLINGQIVTWIIGQKSKRDPIVPGEDYAMQNQRANPSEAQVSLAADQAALTAASSGTWGSVRRGLIGAVLPCVRLRR